MVAGTKEFTPPENREQAKLLFSKWFDDMDDAMTPESGQGDESNEQQNVNQERDNQ